MLSSTQQVLDSVASRLLDRSDDIVAEMLARNAAEVPGYLELQRDAQLRATIEESARANLRSAVQALRHDRDAAGAVPTDAREEARWAARAGVPFAALAKTYRIGHLVASEALVDEIAALDLEPEPRAALLRLVNRYVFGYIDAAIEIARQEHDAERARLSRRRGERRLQMVRDILGGSTIDAGVLSYELGARHLAFVAWGAATDAQVAAIGEADRRPLLAVRPDDDVVWGWLGGHWPFAAANRARLAAAAGDAGVRVAFGVPAEGAAGFRTSHARAQSAHRVALRLDRPVTWYRDVALEALGLLDEPAARELVADRLGALAACADPDPKLRTTLETYLACGMNAAATAARLGIADRTVAYRLKAVERLLGGPLAKLRADVDVALRLERLLA